MICSKRIHLCHDEFFNCEGSQGLASCPRMLRFIGTLFRNILRWKAAIIEFCDDENLCRINGYLKSDVLVASFCLCCFDLHDMNIKNERIKEAIDKTPIYFVDDRWQLRGVTVIDEVLTTKEKINVHHQPDSLRRAYLSIICAHETDIM